MIYLEIITSIVIFILMAIMSAISTSYLSISERDFNFNDIKDKKKVKNIKLVLKNSSSFISSIKSAISFFNLWLGALIVEIIASPIYRDINVPFQGTAYIFKYIIILATVLLLAYFLYVFAEIIPKSFAIKNKKQIVLSTINLVYGFSIIFAPITYFLKATEEVIMRVFNLERKEKISYKDSEVKEAVEIGKEMGVLSKQDSDIISNFLKLDEMTVKDIMVDIENVVTIDLKSSKEKIKEVILNYGFTRIPVCDGDIRNVVGVINIKNVLKNTLESKNLSTDKYVKPCMIVPSGKRLDLLFNEMKNNKEHMAIVVKEKNIAIGIVTMEDIIEEIVGSIEDDFEKYK